MKSAFSLLSVFVPCLTAALFVYCGPTETKQTITITSPVAGAKVLAGDTISVQWTPSIANPGLAYNYNLASSLWQPFETVVPVNSQEVKVVLPTTWYSDSFQIKVVDNDGAHDAGVTGYLHEKYIFLTNTLAGQTINVGDSVNLTWRINSSLFSSLELMLSTDSGKSFNNLVNHSIQPTITSYTWLVGSETGSVFAYPSPRCAVQIRDYTTRDYKDVSGIFTVTTP
jgi:hypothetical protein